MISFVVQPLSNICRHYRCRYHKIFSSTIFITKHSYHNCNNFNSLKSILSTRTNLTSKQREFATTVFNFTNQSTMKHSIEHIYPNNTPVTYLDANQAFNGLSPSERLYGHYLSKASWFGSLIVLLQTSPESPYIFVLLRRLLYSEPLEQLHKSAIENAKLSEDEWKAFLVYSSAFYSNLGNYRGFGDSKFVPDFEMEKMDALIKCSVAYAKDAAFLDDIWNKCKQEMFSIEPNHLGFAPKGVTTYWSKNITTEQDQNIVKEFLLNNKIEAYNTRALKDVNSGQFIIRFASVRSTDDPLEREFMDKFQQPTDGKHSFRLERGDYSPLLELVNKYLDKAKQYGNETEKRMLQHYIDHFRCGDLNMHKDGSREWIKNKGPIVEAYIGFIENYRDPAGERAEFEGFVAMVNKELSAKFSKLVNSATQLIPLLPWPKQFEKDRFLQPDFTSLDVLTIAGSGVYSGVNIPNYDEIRQNEGFKNVSLGNIIQARFKLDKANFLSAKDAELCEKYSASSFEIQVALHELLGHGTGKLLKRESDGTLNYNANETIDPLTGQPPAKCYSGNQTYDSVFGSLGSPYEECRAESVAMYLSVNKLVHEIFGYNDLEEAKKVVRVTWLNMVRQGIEGLKMYNVEDKKWLQAHSQARYVISRVLIENAKPLVNVEYIEKSESDGKPDLLITMNEDYSLIETIGHKAMADFLLKLQVYKSTGDIERAQQMFDHYSKVADDLEYPYLRFRKIVIDRMKPRQLFVQAHTVEKVDGSDVELRPFEANFEGMIQSFQEHFSGEDVDSMLLKLAEKDAIFWK